MAPLCVCYSCKSIMDCNPSGSCDLCEGVTGVIREQATSAPTNLVEVESAISPPDDRQILNILQRLHQNILRENEPYVSYTKACRWQFNQGTYGCEHVKIPQEDVIATYNRQMTN